MAVIGPMKKLTIGNKTYLIATGLDNLPIASASTLGGIKVGTGLTIDSTTGVLSATGTEVTIDNTISGTSTNPVQNKVIKEYVDGLVAGVLHYKGTKATTAALPSSGNITGDVWHVTLDGGEYAWDGSTWQELGTVTDLSGYMASADYPDLTAIEGISATSGLLKKTAANTWTLDTSNYLTSFTETDPVYSASAAAGITSTDIANWNGKVSDDKTWNGVSLDKSLASMSNNSCRIPFTWDTNGETSARMMKANKTPTASNIALYDDNSYLNSTTPTAGDSSTKVATTAFVQSELPTKVSDLTNDSGFTTNTGTVTSVGLTNATNGGLSISGSPITSSGSITVGHSNVLSSAQITQAVYPIKIDKNGHISEYGSAVTSMPASDVYNWAKASTKPSYTASEISGALYKDGSYTSDEITYAYGIYGLENSPVMIPAYSSTITDNNQIVTKKYVDDSIPTKVSDLTNDSGFLTTETDPVFTASAAAGITSSNITNWNKVYNLLTVSSDNNYNDYWWTMTIPRSGLYAYTNAPGSSGRLRYINVPSVEGSSMTQLELPTSNGKLALIDDIPIIPTNISAFTNDSGYLTSYTETDPTVPSWAKESTKPSYTASLIGAATDDHVHGNITNGGDITATAPTIASGDKLIINDLSTSKITNGPSFGTSTTQYLANNGTWQNVPDISGKIDTAGTGLSKSGTTLNHSNSVTAQTIQAIYPIKIDAQGHISEYGSAATIPDRRSWVGTCSTAAATAAKEVVCSDFTANDLTAGSRILVTFSETNSAAVADLTLSVNSTTAKSIKYINNGTLGNLNSAGYLKADTTYLFIYDGTYWVAYFNYNTTYSGMSDALYQAGTSTTNRLISPARLKAAIQLWDSKVTQSAAITTAGLYPVILGYNTGTAAVTNTVNKSADLTYNPNTKTLTNIGNILCGSIDDNYGLNDEALLSSNTMSKWETILDNNL